jgi:hypothetical protein
VTPTREQIITLIRAAAPTLGVDPDLSIRQCAAESSFRADAVSPCGAMGLYQLMEATAEELGVDRRNWKQNVWGGLKYVAWLTEHYGGDHLIYCGDYLDPTHEYFKLDIDALFEKFAASLTRFNPAFERSWVKDYWLSRTPYAQPIPPINHSQNIPAIRTPLKGLYFASMSQVYPWDRGTNYAVEIGRRTAAMVMEDGGQGNNETSKRVDE